MAEVKRRAETDARLEYLYSFLSDASEIPRNELQEQIHASGLVRKSLGFHFKQKIQFKENSNYDINRAPKFHRFFCRVDHASC